MKPSFDLPALLALGLMLAGGCSSDQSGAETPTEQVTGSAANEVLGVDHYMRHVDQYPGEVQVKGVVSMASGDDHTLALIDVDEFQRCGRLTCAQLALPVRWAGPMPSVQEVVQVTGEVQRDAGKLVFSAQLVESVQEASGTAR